METNINVLSENLVIASISKKSLSDSVSANSSAEQDNFHKQ